MLTQARLKEVLKYDRKTGVFTWRTRLTNRVHVGDVAGSPEGKYLAIGIDGRRYRAHRLAWFYVHGSWPKVDTDHKNGKHRDNRVSNLRDASRSLNMLNAKRAHRDSKSGLLGVVARNSRWAAELMVGGKKRHLGVFSTPGEAHRAYLKARRHATRGLA